MSEANQIAEDVALAAEAGGVKDTIVVDVANPDVSSTADGLGIKVEPGTVLVCSGKNGCGKQETVNDTGVPEQFSMIKKTEKPSNNCKQCRSRVATQWSKQAAHRKAYTAKYRKTTAKARKFVTGLAAEIQQAVVTASPEVAIQAKPHVPNNIILPDSARNSERLYVALRFGLSRLFMGEPAKKDAAPAASV